MVKFLLLVTARTTAMSASASASGGVWKGWLLKNARMSVPSKLPFIPKLTMLCWLKEGRSLSACMKQKEQLL